MAVPSHHRDRTLFAGWALVREAWFEIEDEAWAAGERWRLRKEKQGYRAVSGFSRGGAGEEQ